MTRATTRVRRRWAASGDTAIARLVAPGDTPVFQPAGGVALAATLMELAIPGRLVSRHPPATVAAPAAGS